MVHISGASFCCLCLKTANTDGMLFSCVECVRLEAGLKRSAGSTSSSSFCGLSCYQEHFGACHRVASSAGSKRPSSGSSSSGSDPGSPPSASMAGRAGVQLSPGMAGHYPQALYHSHPSPPPAAHRRGSGDGRQHYQQQRSRRA